MIPELESGPNEGDADAIAAMLHRREDSVHAVLSGTLEKPVLTGREGDIARLKGDVSLLVSTARAGSALPASHIEVDTVTDRRGAQQQAQLMTGRAAQVLLFLQIGRASCRERVCQYV